MSDVFISHVEEDAEIALEIAVGLEEVGYRTWCYEVDNIPGPSYLIQTGQAVEQAKALVLIISPHSLGSRQVTKEVIRAHETGKEFVPVLRDITHIEFQNRQPEWREALGAASSIRIPMEGVADIIPRIISGIRASDILPGSRPEAAHIAQIRKTLGELQGRSMLEKTKEQPTTATRPKPEDIAAEIPRAQSSEGARGRKKRMRLALAPVVVVRPVWFWTGVCLSMLAAMMLAICLSIDFEGKRDLIIGVAIFVFPPAVAGGFCLKHGLKKHYS